IRSLLSAPATSQLYTLSLHDALPIFDEQIRGLVDERTDRVGERVPLDEVVALFGKVDGRFQPRDEIEQRRVDLRDHAGQRPLERSEEHTSELQSRFDLVCRLLLEKKK